MHKYLFEIRYNAEGVKGVAREGGSSRRAAATQAIESLGGKVEAFYFAHGDVDVYAIVGFANPIDALATSLTVNQTGVMSVKTVVLIAPEELDAAAKKTVAFRPPGA